jgi:hypothetical protein
VGLALAIGFTAIANALLLATLVWYEWLPSQARGIGLGALGVIWVVALIEGRAEWRRLLAEWSTNAPRDPLPDPRSDQWFRQSQAAYLAGDWVSAEQRLLELLRLDARDAESRLMLATLWRHEGRFDAASDQLDRLDRLETAAAWRDEVAWERERICANRVKTVPQEGLGTVDRVEVGVAKATVDIGARSGGTQIAATNRRMAA